MLSVIEPAIFGSSACSVSPPRSTTRFSRIKVADVRSVLDSLGVLGSPLTMIMPPGSLADFSAGSATPDCRSFGTILTSPLVPPDTFYILPSPSLSDLRGMGAPGV